MTKTVTFNISKDTNTLRPSVSLGERIKLAKDSWGISRHRIKNKQMVFRMKRKEYYPYLIVTNINNADYLTTTLTVKPYNF